MSRERERVTVGNPIGYCDTWSVAYGETVRLMVSASSTYRASLIRLAGNGSQFETAVPSEIEGEYQGRIQTTRTGSCVVMDQADALRFSSGVTVYVWVWPTRPRAEREQVIIGDGAWTLFIDAAGCLGFRVMTRAGTAELKTTQSLTERAWSFVSGSYDPGLGDLRLRRHELGLFAPPPEALRRSARPASLVETSAGIVIAASPAAESGHFDGKLEAPTIYGRQLSDDELLAKIAAESDDVLPPEGLVAAWRFQHEMAADRVVDIGPSRLHGRAINGPARAMTGHRWRAADGDPRGLPEEYGAIHFHADDLVDAGWTSDLTLRVSEGLPSGVYAIKLVSAAGSEDRVPFVVRPRPQRPTADVALVLPTLTYLAYANERPLLPDSYQAYRFERVPELSAWDAWLAAHPEFGMSLYDTHEDGSGCCYSSRLRPIPSLRPDYRASALGFPRHLAADLYVVEWLDTIGVDVDILTDEDVHDEGVDLLGTYRVVLTGSHPEYVTGQMYDAFEGYVMHGGRLMYLGGNGFYWVTSYGPRRTLIEVRRGQTNQLPWDSRPGELHHATTGEPGGLWELRGRPARALLGVGTTAMGLAARPYVRTAASRDPRYAWIFDGLPDEEPIGGAGDMLGDAGGYEIDRADTSLGSPPRTVILASTVGDETAYELHSSGSLFVGKPPAGEPPHACAHLTMLETSTGGAVFSVGSMTWVGSLPARGGRNPVSIVTRNVLTAFLDKDLPTGSRSHR